MSLDHILNPVTEADAPQATTTSTSPPGAHRRESLAPLQYVQSPVEQESISPYSARLPQPSYVHSYPVATESDAVQALAALASGNAVPPVPNQWHTQSYSSEGSIHHRRSYSNEQRPGSSGIVLPAPAQIPSSTELKQSPTLERYHVPSPEERRASIVSPPQLNPTQSGVTLPPIHNFSQGRPSTGGQGSLQYEHGEVDNLTGGQRSEQSPLETHFPPNPYQSHAPQKPVQSQELASSPADIKQERTITPRPASPASTQHTPFKPVEVEMESAKAVASLKNEHGLRTHSPLRESSVPVQSTETATPEPTMSKKRPAPSRTKKGTATTKKAHPAKKRKVEHKRSLSPSSQASKPPTFKTASSKGTPAYSSPAPTTRSQSVEADDEPYDDEDEGPAGSDEELYCICRKPDNGTFMIGCDGTCDDWFHGKCVGIEERDKNLIDKYICPSCTKGGVGRTSWKRMCRRKGCRVAARVNKTKNGKDGSKFCSEECGVLHFRAELERTRGREEMAKYRNSRRKSSMVGNQRPSLEDDLGARGGIISAGELKSLVNTSKSAQDFKRLGEGVLSPPSTPDLKSPDIAKQGLLVEFTESETKALEDIARQKDDARRKHQLLKDRQKFINMAKQAASRAATEKELKPKEYCGYDSRIEWTESQFGLWRKSKIGVQAFELETLATDVSTASKTEDIDMADLEDEALLNDFEICDRKKCARHLEWSKLAIDDVRFEMGDNSNRMRALEDEEKAVKQRAALRGKRGALTGEGRVEVASGLGINMNTGATAVTEEPDRQAVLPTAMEVDALA